MSQVRIGPRQVGCLAAICVALFGGLAQADVDKKTTTLDTDQCLELFAAIVASEAVDYGQEYPFLYRVKGAEAEILMKYPAAWLYDDPLDRWQPLLDAMGFRTGGLEALVCSVRTTDVEPATCMIGVAREDLGELGGSDGVLAFFEFVGEGRCDALLKRM